MTDFPFELPILNDQQFSRDDVLLITTLSAGQLKGMLDREQVRLRVDHNPGTGRRRMFSGSDILKIETARVASKIGFPLKWVYLLADKVHLRATHIIDGTAKHDSYKHFGLAFYPNKDSTDVAFVPMLDGKPDSPLPVAVQMMSVDRLITETIAKLNAIVDEQEIPDFEFVEFPKQEDPFSPENDTLLMWSKDEEGRTIRVGLNYEDTQELCKLEDLSMSREHSSDQGERYLELHNIHERARMKRINDTAIDRAIDRQKD